MVFTTNSMFAQSTNVGIGTSSPHNSALLDMQSTSKGILVPRMNSSQRSAISTPATGLLVFDTNTESFWFRGAAGWVELVDTTNNTWKKNGANAFLEGTGNVGIGTSSPVYDMHISRPAPSIGFNDAGQNHFSGIIQGDSADLIINAYRRGLGTNAAGNLVLQVGRSGFPTPLYAGNVGIGTSDPDVKLQIEGGTDASAASGGSLQIGSSSGANTGFDENEIQARNNGAAGKLFLQAAGGDLQIGGTNNIIINDGYQVYRNRPLSTSADLLPIAYAKMDGFGATVLSGTGNLSMQKTDDGNYRIVLLGEANIYTNRNLYSIIVSPNYTAVPLFATAEIKSDNSINVQLRRPWVHYSNSTCDGCTFSYINNAQHWQNYDAPFTIVVYKM